MPIENAEHEARLLKVGRQYAELYDEPEQFALIYAEDLVVNDGVYTGRKALIASEKAFRAFAPRRAMRADHMHVSGDDMVIVRGVILDPDRGQDWELPFAAFLRVNEDGLIAEDYTYADFTRLLAPKEPATS
jgi:hypothetical protein